jgi:hypothetical protein
MNKLITILFLLIVSIINAQTTISGKVTDAKNEPINGANVYLEGTYDGATTDYQGNFSCTT